MKTNTLILLSLSSLAAAVPYDLPESEHVQWHTGLVDSFFSSLSGWSFGQAAQIVQDDKSSPAGLGDKDKTVWEQLESDQDFTKLVKVIKFAEFEDNFDNKDHRFTFFAPNNDAFKGLHHHHHHHRRHRHQLDLDQVLEELQTTPSLDLAVHLLDQPSFAALSKGGDEHHKEKIKLIQRIVGGILHYHTILGEHTVANLIKNSTIATLLHSAHNSNAGLNHRIKIDRPLLTGFAPVLNYFVRIVEQDKAALNGVIHVVNAPLFPLLSILDTTFGVPDIFSTLTSAVQRLHASDRLDFHYHVNKSAPFDYTQWTPQGTATATLFAPTNLAFKLLPKELKVFLFSPFGRHVLGKILAYHYLPDTLLLSELLVDNRKDGHELEWFEGDGDDLSYQREFDIATSLPNATLHISAVKKKIFSHDEGYKTHIQVNDQYAADVDTPVLNGAFHALSRVLIPPHKHHDAHGVDVSHLDTWENWAEWLPAFAAEQ